MHIYYKNIRLRRGVVTAKITLPAMLLNTAVIETKIPVNTMVNRDPEVVVELANNAFEVFAAHSGDVYD